MKYNLNIMMTAFVHHCPNLDVRYAYIIDYVRDWHASASKKIDKHIDDTGVLYVRVNIPYLIAELPQIGVTSKSSGSRMISRIEKDGLFIIKTIGRDMYIALDEKVDLLYQKYHYESGQKDQGDIRESEQEIEDNQEPLQNCNNAQPSPVVENQETVADLQQSENNRCKSETVPLQNRDSTVADLQQSWGTIGGTTSQNHFTTLGAQGETSSQPPHGFSDFEPDQISTPEPETRMQALVRIWNITPQEQGSQKGQPFNKLCQNIGNVFHTTQEVIEFAEWCLKEKASDRTKFHATKLTNYKFWFQDYQSVKLAESNPDSVKANSRPYDRTLADIQRERQQKSEVEPPAISRENVQKGMELLKRKGVKVPESMIKQAQNI